MSPLGHLLPSGFLSRTTARQGLLQRTRAGLMLWAAATAMFAVGDVVSAAISSRCSRTT